MNRKLIMDFTPPTASDPTSPPHPRKKQRVNFEPLQHAIAITQIRDGLEHLQQINNDRLKQVSD